MMSREITTLFEQAEDISQFTAITGEKKPGPGYHQLQTPAQTITFDLPVFSGDLTIQGTLEMFPGEADWVTLKDINTGQPITVNGDQIGTFLTMSSLGNFIWVRVIGNINSSQNIRVLYQY